MTRVTDTTGPKISIQVRKNIMLWKRVENLVDQIRQVKDWERSRTPKSAGNKSHMKRETMESQPRERVQERQKLEVKENYWGGYQRLGIRTWVQKKSYPTPVAGRRAFQVRRATWKSHNWKGRSPKKNATRLQRIFLLLTAKLHAKLYVLALVYKKIRLISRIMEPIKIALRHIIVANAKFVPVSLLISSNTSVHSYFQIFLFPLSSI